MDKLPPKRFVLKDNHPVMEKFNKLCEFADELGISFSFGAHYAILYTEDMSYSIEDIEDSHHAPNHFPPSTEVKLVYDNPAYLAHVEKERQEYRKACEERDAAMKAAEDAKIAAENLARERAKELADRELYAKLKEKFG